MRLRRRIEGDLGPVTDRSWIPVVPARWRLPVLVTTVVICAVIFLVALLIGLHRA